MVLRGRTKCAVLLLRCLLPIDGRKSAPTFINGFDQSALGRASINQGPSNVKDRPNSPVGRDFYVFLKRTVDAAYKTHFGTSKKKNCCLYDEPEMSLNLARNASRINGNWVYLMRAATYGDFREVFPDALIHSDHFSRRPQRGKCSNYQMHARKNRNHKFNCVHKDRSWQWRAKEFRQVALKKSKKWLNEDDAASVLALHSVRDAPRLSLRRRAIETEISKSHLQRIFKQNRILPFKLKFKHTLEEGDEAKHLDFCLEMGNRVLNDEGFHKRILFSDEST
ncbi:hypothetical protein NQ318_013829 [Aromia moschata]|uniref:Uncharacterized protein n=1 Tax=Aromia moschata TaxID=1265417 RepID=A0AAV8Z8M3_9CUCU|nr:hypothetical protein NQ318_013829 [Aromia moschata]